MTLAPSESDVVTALNAITLNLNDIKVVRGVPLERRQAWAAFVLAAGSARTGVKGFDELTDAELKLIREALASQIINTALLSILANDVLFEDLINQMVGLQQERDQAALVNRRRFTTDEVLEAATVFKTVRPGIWDTLKRSLTLDRGGLEFGLPAAIAVAQTCMMQQLTFIDYKSIHYKSEAELMDAIRDLARRELNSYLDK